MKIFFRKLLIVRILFSAIFVIVSFFKGRNSGEKVQFILWASGIGAFVWKDMLIFSFNNILAAAIILLLNDFRYTLIFVDVFWIIRLIGEKFFWFLQQFNQPTQYPHNYYARDWNVFIKSLLGNISDQNISFHAKSSGKCRINWILKK